MQPPVFAKPRRLRRVSVDLVTAPFTPEQVEALNAYQTDGWMHPFTCGPCRDTLGIIEPGGGLNDRLLVATVDGWVCPTCDYTQGWAHGFMADADFATKVKAAYKEAGRSGMRLQ